MCVRLSALCVFVLVCRRPTRTLPLYSSAASDVYKGQMQTLQTELEASDGWRLHATAERAIDRFGLDPDSCAYTHLRANETKANSVSRLLLEQKNSPSRLPLPNWPIVAHIIRTLTAS